MRGGKAHRDIFSDTFPVFNPSGGGVTDQILQISSSVIPVLLLGENIMQFDVSGASKALVHA